jgi:hypothetical protein
LGVAAPNRRLIQIATCVYLVDYRAEPLAIGIYLEVLASPEAVEAAGACDAQITPESPPHPDSMVSSSLFGAVIIANSLSPSFKMLASSTWPGYGTPAKGAP